MYQIKKQTVPACFRQYRQPAAEKGAQPGSICEDRIEKITCTKEKEPGQQREIITGIKMRRRKSQRRQEFCFIQKFRNLDKGQIAESQEMAGNRIKKEKKQKTYAHSDPGRNFG